MKIRVNNIALMFEKYNYRTLETNNKSDLKNHLDLFEFEKSQAYYFFSRMGLYLLLPNPPGTKR